MKFYIKFVFVTVAIFSTVSTVAAGIKISSVHTTEQDLAEFNDKLLALLDPISEKDFSIQSVKKLEFSRRSGVLVCVESKKQQYPYKPPYAFFKSGSVMYHLGGGEFCHLPIGEHAYTEYRLKKPGNLGIKDGDKEAIGNGQVVLEFTVTYEGKAENLRIISNSTKSKRAEEIAIDAISRSEYRTREVAGQKSSVHGLRRTFTF
ncbi:energy transducer TonB [uncultured Pseudoteredinibacter sp.]|uniref:energy transducer TonB n=1 Tax=uncultured Pseudoteredinibacter sp. TaxID=1641701 RepID=UPI00260E57B3|nr:energy transducer TonB [uncultured Pseudoteredinibacter sp.]